MACSALAALHVVEKFAIATEKSVCLCDCTQDSATGHATSAVEVAPGTALSILDSSSTSWTSPFLCASPNHRASAGLGPSTLLLHAESPEIPAAYLISDSGIVMVDGRC